MTLPQRPDELVESDTAPEPPVAPQVAFLRGCGACDRTDDGPRTLVDLGDGRLVHFHVPGSELCGMPGADPYPDRDESALDSQFRLVAEAAGLQVPEHLNIQTVDCSDPANHNAPADLEV